MITFWFIIFEYHTDLAYFLYL